MKSTLRIVGGPSCLSAVVMMAALALSSWPAAAADPTPFGTNLVRNPKAEVGAPGPTVPAWETDTDFAVVKYGAAGMPSKAESEAIGGDKQLFYTGPYSETFDACGSGAQYIHIRDRNSEIDSGDVKVKLAAYLGTKTKSDSATVTLQFRDGNNHQVGSKQLTLGPISTKRKMLLDSASLTVPAKARIFRVQFLGNVLEETCDAFFDNVSVIIELR